MSPSLSNTTLPHTQLCHSQLFTNIFVTHNFVTHNPAHFVTGNFVTHHVSPRNFVTHHSFTTQLCDIQSFTHNFVTHNSSDAIFTIVAPPPSPLSFRLSPFRFNFCSCLLEEIDFWGWSFNLVLVFLRLVVRYSLPYAKKGRPNIILQVFPCWDLWFGAVHDLQHGLRECLVFGTVFGWHIFLIL